MNNFVHNLKFNTYKFSKNPGNPGSLPLKAKFIALETYKSYFFNLNKWAIDKAPKVSASSYLVGLGFIFLVHLYTMNNWEKLTYLSFSFFSLDLYLINLFIFLLLLLASSYNRNSNFLGAMLLVPVLFIIVYYLKHGVMRIVTNKMLNVYSTAVSFKFSISWEFYLFVFFLFGWILKLGQKYSVESLTKAELQLYKSVIPTMYLFETITLFYIIAWRYLNTTLAGYATVMYCRYYKNQEVTNFLITKLLFFNSAVLIVFLLVILNKMQRETEFLFVFFIFILYSIFFLVKEGNEIWVFTHQTMPLNLSKFTYFKFLKFLMFFNYFHLYVVVLFSLVLFVRTLQKDNNILNSYEFLFVIIKNLYFILWFIVITYFSIYVITNLDFQYPLWSQMFYKVPVRFVLNYKEFAIGSQFSAMSLPVFR
jgi:hypothetical protein